MARIAKALAAPTLADLRELVDEAASRAIAVGKQRRRTRGSARRARQGVGGDHARVAALTATHHVSGVREERAAADRGSFWPEVVTADAAASARAARRAAVAGGSGGSP
jgi:hypothetical protein